MNGNGLANASYMPPLPAGHQQDLNYLYSQIQELSGILKSNREKVNVITKTAEEVAVSPVLTEKGHGGSRQARSVPMVSRMAEKTTSRVMVRDLCIPSPSEDGSTLTASGSCSHSRTRNGPCQSQPYY